MRAVSDASPLIALSLISRLDLLPKLFSSVIVPPAVASEIKSFQLPVWVRVIPLPANLPKIAGMEALGPGEAEAIRLALQLSPDRLLLDDGQGRRVARALNLRVTGVLGLLVTARESGLIESIRPEVDSLIARGFHISDWLYDDLVADG